MVHFNAKYGDSITEAIENGNGAKDVLAVIGIKYEIQEEKENVYLSHIVHSEMINGSLVSLMNEFCMFVHLIKGLDHIPNTMDETDIYKFPLNYLMPEDTDHFYRYEGSLTTPECNEIVIWNVMKVVAFGLILQ